MYTKKEWKDRVVEKPRTFTMTTNPDGTITLTPEEGFIVEAGTPIIAENMNNIENGLEELFRDKVVISSTPPASTSVIWLEV